MFISCPTYGRTREILPFFSRLGECHYVISSPPHFAIAGSIWFNGQKLTGMPTTAMIMLFNSQNPFNCTLENRPIEKVPELNLQNYQPQGVAPLLDLVGMAINSLNCHMETVSETSRSTQVIFAVATDGQENASCEFSHADI